MWKPRMTNTLLADLYHGYIDCLNEQAWPRLGDFVDDDVVYNGQQVGLDGYRQMLEGDFQAIPDLRFMVELLVTDDSHIASRLHFDCTPAGMLFDLPVNGRRVHFDENVFYRIDGGKIREVLSVIDKTAIRDQLSHRK
jgi:predicted ester cyclase